MPYTVIALLEKIFTVAAPIVADKLKFFDHISRERAAQSGYHPVDSKMSAYLKAESQKGLEYIQKALDHKPYFVEDRITQADIAIYSFLTLMKQVDIDILGLSDWLQDRCKECPFDTMFND